jgi:hypothetical protein
VQSPTTLLTDLPAPQSNFLLLEITAILFVDENKVQVILDRELVIDVTESGREVEPTQEKSDGDGFTYKKSIWVGNKQNVKRLLVLQCRSLASYRALVHRP